MHKTELINKLERNNVFQVKKDEDFEFINKITPILDIETYFVGKIKLYKLEENLLIKERDDKGYFYYRKIDSENDFHEFTKQRLDLYDRMWDGCGCKADYNEVWEKKID